MAGGADRTFVRTPQSAAWTLRVQWREGQATPLRFFCNCINLTREALLFFGSFCHKRNRGCGVSPPVGEVARSARGVDRQNKAPTLRAKHGKRKKALRGGRGENKSFPPSNTTSLYEPYFKTVRWTVLKEQYRADLSLQHSKIVVQKQSTGLFLRKC